jgi:uncharacterized cupredoxin-like copper-binding protein
LTIRALLAAAALMLAAGVADAETSASPSWLSSDPAGKKAVIDVVAAFNENNSNWNFNGYHTGNATVLVPTGWTVDIVFHNKEEEVTHSLVVIADPNDEMEHPQEAGPDLAAFPQAYTEHPIEGTAVKDSGGKATFTAEKAGDYLWYCGVPGHGIAGMWIRFKVGDDVEAPSMTVAADAEAGRE